MSVTAAEIIYYGSASMPEDSSTTCGGAIDTTTYVIPDSASLFNTLNDTVNYVSSNSGDTTQTVTTYGRNSAGSIVSETKSLNGTTPVAGTTTFERLLKIVISASHAGTVTVTRNTGGTTIGTLPTGILTLRRPFYNVSSDASGGSSRDYYEKLFSKNTDSTLALLAAQVAETANPSGKITFALATSVNDSESTANNLTAPASVSSFNTTTKNVPGTDLAGGSAIGIWLKLTLAAGDTADKSTVTLQTTGQTI